MFNLGYKEVVLNSLGEITGDANVINIPGYGKIKHGQISNPVQTASAPAVQELTSWTAVIPSMPVDAWGKPHIFVKGDVFEVEIKLRSLRNVSSIARDFIVDGKSIVFQSTPVLTADEAGIAAAIDLGATLAVQSLNEIETYFSTNANGAEVELEVAKGMEHIFIKSVSIKLVAHGGLPFTQLVQSSITAGSVGVGLGKFIEESRRMATKENVMPYAQNHGGNDQGVDVRGTYKAYTFDFQGEDTGTGWESHEYVDHSYVNAAMASKPTHYVIYANDSAADLKVILDAFVV